MHRSLRQSSLFRLRAFNTFTHPAGLKARFSKFQKIVSCAPCSQATLSAPSIHRMSTNTPLATAPLLVRFYSKEAPDPLGRTLPTILQWNDRNLEYSHDYIQTLFPLPEYSPINPSAPVINEATFTAFRSSLSLRQALQMAFRRMLHFYGLEIQLEPKSDGSDITFYTIAPSSIFSVRAPNWVTSMNHNHLRITRIIRSLRVLGCQAEAEAFVRGLTAVHQHTGRIGSRSLRYWTRAARRPLNVAPEDESDEGQGKVWLKGLGDKVGEELKGLVIVGNDEEGAKFKDETA